VKTKLIATDRGNVRNIDKLVGDIAYEWKYHDTPILVVSQSYMCTMIDIHMGIMAKNCKQHPKTTTWVWIWWYGTQA
jgi:hypothetical protein